MLEKCLDIFAGYSDTIEPVQSFGASVDISAEVYSLKIMKVEQSFVNYFRSIFLCVDSYVTVIICLRLRVFTEFYASTN